MGKFIRTPGRSSKGKYLAWALIILTFLLALINFLANVVVLKGNWKSLFSIFGGGG